MDWIDPMTAEVKQVDVLWESIRSHCSKQLNYISETTPLATAVLRVLVANDNSPLSPKELYQRIGRSSPEVVLRLLTAGQVYYGIAPVPPEQEEREEEG